MLTIPPATPEVAMPVKDPVPLILFARLLPMLLVLILAKTEPPLELIIVKVPDPPVIPVNVFPLITLLAESVGLVIAFIAPLLFVIILVKLFVFIF